jgi:AraC-like DNA-binding protein/ligand-binding sensor protein
MPHDSPTFDHAAALDAAEHFSESTGIVCIVLNADGRTLVRDARARLDPDGTLPCDFCRTFRAATGEPVACREAHLYGSFQSMRFGGRYTYFCPLGLTHISAPIIADGRLAGSLVGGPILLVDHDDFMDELAEKHALEERALRTVGGAAKRVSVVSTRRARSLAETLLFAASWVSGINVRELVEEEERLSREARLSDYIHDIKTMGGGNASVYPAEMERELLETIRQGDRERAMEVLERLLATIRVSAGEAFAEVKSRVLELVVLLSRAAIDGGADAESVFGINYRALSDVDRLGSVEELSGWVAGIADRYVQFVFDVRNAGQSDAVIGATRAMRRRLGEKIGLEEIAAEVNLSPAYLSRIFKEETGTSFSSYLAGLRVERAKYLLRNTDDTLLSIALDVGFSDQSHFSRVFRERVGQTPSRYRSAVDQFPSDRQEIHE